MELLRDWQFWGVVVSIIGVIIAIITYLLQRNNRKLVYSILADTPLLSIDEEIKGKIKIVYGKKNIQNIHLVVLKIENKGNTHIASPDYEEPIKFTFQGSEILSAEIIEVSPRNLRPKIQNQSSNLTINPILLNGKDYFVIKILFSEFERKIEADAHIVGVRKIEWEKRDDPKMRRMYAIVMVSSISLTLTLLIKSYLPLENMAFISDALDRIILAMILTPVIFYIASYMREK